MKQSPMPRGTAVPKRSNIAPGTSPLKRTAIAASTKPLRRTAIAAGLVSLARSGIQTGAIQLARLSPISWKQVDGTGTAMPLRKRRLRTRGPRMTPIRRSAEGEDCTLKFPGICRNNTETTVWCHSNKIVDGKGMGIKANDDAGCYGCGHCHAFLDGGWASFPDWTVDMVQQHFEVARALSRPILKHKGLIAE